MFRTCWFFVPVFIWVQLVLIIVTSKDFDLSAYFDVKKKNCLCPILIVLKKMLFCIYRSELWTSMNEGVSWFSTGVDYASNSKYRRGARPRIPRDLYGGRGAPQETHGRDHHRLRGLHPRLFMEASAFVENEPAANR